MGEIFLVVIGILIAVSIDDWNEQQKEQKAEQQLLKKVLGDLETDMNGFVKNNLKTDEIQAFHQSCFSVILGKKAFEGITFDNPNLIRRTIYYNRLTKENFPDLPNSVRDEEIKEAISEYFRWINTMDEAYGEWNEVVLRIRQNISLLKGHNLAALYQKDDLAFKMDGNIMLITHERLKELLKDEYFQQLLLESNLKLQDTKGSLDSLINKNQNLRLLIEQKTTE